MAVYTVAHKYRCTTDGRSYGPWVPGEKVDLTPVEAEWLERDSPGVLEPLVRQEKQTANRQDRPTANRQLRSGKDRGGE